MKRNATWAAGALLAGLWTGLGSGEAAAQTVDENLITPNLPLEFDRGRNIGVLQRERPEYQAVGVPLSSFTLYPKVEAGVGFSDNAYQISGGSVSDGFVMLSPSVTASSNWAVNQLTLDANYRAKRYFSETPRNENNYSVGANGRLDITRSWTLDTQLRTARNTEPRASAASPQDAADSVQYQQTSGGIGTTFSGARVRGQLTANFDTLSFDDVKNFAGGTLDLGNRDQTVLRTTGRGEFAISPDTSLFAQVGYTDTSYDQQLLPGVANRDSNEINVLGGATFDLSALIRGAVGVGYVDRRYDAPIYKDLSGIAAEAKVEYFPSQLTTLGVTVRRTVQDSYFFNSSGYFATAAAFRVDHELLRNLLLNAQVAYEVDDFTENAGTIKIFRVSGGGRYLLNREFGLGFVIGHDKRSGTGSVATNTFNETRALISVIVQR
ncbi:MULTISPECIES: outer membrane beta-barrel protein [unclassified Sphingomonas]|uniref:outer membrane beta-barrel protein n=1 Tax=unclassified Sphingomonas TaxID=196159 RepID=UPI00226B6B1D|nr:MULTISPECIES: outer membrane beta-barrel protein [unclassified Sphingomonas]